MRGRDGNWKRNSCAAVCHLPPSLAMSHAVAIPQANTLESRLAFGNMMEIDRNGSFPFIQRSQTHGNFAPYSTTWSVEMERRLGRFVNVRTNYQHTTSGGGILLTEQQHEGRNVHALGAGGRSTYRQFEATARLSWERGQQMLFSYVRSKALGDLNTFTAYLGDFQRLRFARTTTRIREVTSHIASL